MQQNSKYRFCGERDEVVNHTVSERKKTSTKGVQDLVQLCGKDDLLVIVREIKIWPYYQIVYAKTRIWPWDWDA